MLGAPVTGAPTAETDKLSEDDAEVEKMMTEYEKPIEKLARSLDNCQRMIPLDPTEGNRRCARQLSNLRKSQNKDVWIGPVKEKPAELEKSETGERFTVGKGNSQELRVTYDDSLDRHIEKSIQGPDADSFYPYGRPTIGFVNDLQRSEECSECGLQKSMALTACPHCGAGTVLQDSGVVGGGYLVKSEQAGPTLRPAQKNSEEVVFSNGIIVKDE
jgi:hypothetical protein